MKRKANKNGFTLVELVVVVCIFGIILGAILNIIKPTNEIYNDADATMHTNVIGSGLAEYIDDELRYSTRIMILRNYRGVPEVSSDGKIGIIDTSFTDCLVIDNNNLRGSNLKNFDPNADTLVNRFGARGALIKVSKLNTEGFNFNNSVVCKGVDFYDKYGYEMNADCDINNYVSGATQSQGAFGASKYQQTLNFTMETSVPEFENGSYVFNKTKFKKEASIELLNINIDKSDAFVAGCQDLEHDIQETGGIYNPYGTWDYATAPAGATDAQKQYYNHSEDNLYTYIFYKKETSANASKFKVRILYSSGEGCYVPASGDVFKEIEVKKGKYFTVPGLPGDIPGYGSPYYTDDSGNSVNPGDSFQITGDKTFYLVYPADASYDKAYAYYQNYEGTDTMTITILAPAGSSGSCGTNIPGAPADIPANLKFEHWGLASDPSKEPVDVYLSKDGTATFVPVVSERYRVRFFADGTELNVGTPYYVDGGAIASYSGEEIPAPSDQMFDQWVLDGTTDVIDAVAMSDSVAQESTDYPGEKEVIFTATYKEKPASALVVTSCTTTTNWNCIVYSVSIKNTGSEDANKVEVRFPKKDSGIKLDGSGCSDWRFSSYTLTGSQFIFTTRDDQSQIIKAGESISATFTIGCNDIKPDGTQISWYPVEDFYHMPTELVIAASDIEVNEVS
ncbi:MAG: type II secretion system protein [Ruminococcus sp.]|nr:type II secretion system protein [Ruminococcus sp.]